MERQDGIYVKLLWALRTFFLAALMLIRHSNVYPYEVITHRNITDEAMGQALNYTRFLNEFQLDVANAENNIKNGSIREDDLPRPRHHFYDPTNGQGICPVFCVPSLEWGYKSERLLVENNLYSWTKAREYMHIGLTGKDFNGLTVATTAAERDQYFQLMFRSVGQVMHLVEDLASPAHVRNDTHLPIPGGTTRDLYEHYALNKYDTTWAFGYPTVKLNQFSDYWNSSLGLAVFTNKNFISQSTNFDDFNLSGQLYYPSPQIDHFTTRTEIVVNQFGVEVPVEVDYGGNTVYDDYAGTTFTNDRLTAFSVFDFDAQEILGERAYSVNDFTAQSAANILVRRAGGYSAGLLDYFFRGQLKITPTSNGLRVKNLSSEPMGSGFIAVYYDDYTLTRHYLAGYALPAPLNPGDETPLISFTRPLNNINGRYIVVFQGQLGAEDGAVIGAMSPGPLYYVSKRSGVQKIFRMGTDGSDQEIVYDNPDPNLGIGKLAPSPDGKTLALTVDGPRIFLLDLTTGALSQLTQGDWPDWSPDGTKIVFERAVTPVDTEIFFRDLLTGNEVKLTNPSESLAINASNRLPVFSPDGRTIAFSKFTDSTLDANCPGLYVIYLMDASGNPIGPLTCDPHQIWIDEAPTWSPDGQEIAFTRYWGRNSSIPYKQLYKVAVGTKTVTKLTDSDGTVYTELTPAWSSDGKFIAIGSNRDGDFDIWRVDPNGGYLNNLTGGNTDPDGFPAYMK